MRCWDGTRAALGVLLALGPAAVGGTDDARPAAGLPAESRAAAARIADARRLMSRKQWPEATAELQRILDTAGDDLVPADARRSVPARQLCHALLVALPPDALRAYRARVDPAARRRLEQAAASRDVSLLRKLVDEAFCSRPAEKALELLGDLAFERGDFDEAAGWYDRLAAPADGAPAADAVPPEYPGPQTDPAKVRAKALLARVFRGGDDDWDGRLSAFRQRHPDATGRLGARKGRLADLLAAYAADRAARPLEGNGPWSTFGGDATRGRVAAAPPGFPESLGGLCRVGPTRRFVLGERGRSGEAPVADGEPPRNAGRARPMSFFPLFAGRYALAADGRCLTAYDLRTGRTEKEPWCDAAALPGVAPEANRPAENAGAAPAPDPHYTLTLDGDSVYARLGTPLVGDPDRGGWSALVCVRLHADADGRRVRWSVAPEPPNPGVNGKETDREPPPVFEGAPLAAGGLVYAAATRVAGGRTVTAVHCYAADADGTPPLRWRRDVVETRDPRPARTAHHLLTLAAGNVVYCSHSGAVVALDARTGKPAWAVRYPPRESAVPDAPQPPPRDPAPCVAAGGRLYAAPADADRLLCLDPVTGRILWEREAVQAVHLLGVGRGRLIFTTPRGLRAVDAAGGGDSGGWMGESIGEAPLAPLGRGLLVGDVVLWPHAAPDAGDPPGRTGVVTAVRQEDGATACDPTLLRNIPAGNLIYDGGLLAVADGESLAVFVPPGRGEGRKAANPVSRAARPVTMGSAPSPGRP